MSVALWGPLSIKCICILTAFVLRVFPLFVYLSVMLTCINIVDIFYFIIVILFDISEKLYIIHNNSSSWPIREIKISMRGAVCCIVCSQTRAISLPSPARLYLNMNTLYNILIVYGKASYIAFAGQIMAILDEELPSPI